MRTYRKTSRALRSVREFARGLAATDHPLLVHLVPIRRCNIDCGYCNEYDKVSKPVPFEELSARIDKLAELGTSVVAFSGGEPMLHPDLDASIARIRSHGMIAGLITNGYLLSPKRITALNDAGLDYLQISIDNVEPDEVSKKSLRLLDMKLQWLAEHAHFDININSVVGGGIKNPEDARTINRRARVLMVRASSGFLIPPPSTELMFTSKVAWSCRCWSFLSSRRRLFFETSSGSMLSMLICRKSSPASFSAWIRLGTRKYPLVIKPAIMPRARMWRIRSSRSGCSIGSPPLKATTEVPRSASLSIRRRISAVGTGGDTLSYSLQ